MEAKQTILRLKKKKKSITEIAAMSGVGVGLELGNSKGLTRQQCDDDNFDDCRILSMVTKNHFTASAQVKNTLQEVDVSVSKFMIKRRLHESKGNDSPQVANH